jgi:ABC-type phosphate transport system substrate-binding protein
MPAATPFVAVGGKELLFLSDKPSARAMELHGKQWNALGRDKDGKPNGTGPAEYLLAGRAATVIVNPANKLESLTLAQVQAIFGGEVEDWGTLGSTGLRPEATPRQGSLTTSKLRINAVGLRSDDPATGIFEKECLDRYKWRRVVVKKDSAEAVAAVSMDPQAIGFVDLAGIPATGQNVRILGIRLPGRGPAAAPPPPAEAGTSPVGGEGVAERTGAAGRVYYPTPENIKSAMYPLSQRLWLYVHPQASDTARDFVKFIATCGGSTSLTAGAAEASPYADTVKSVMDTYRRHGLVPLADAALERMVKDAMADAAARAKAGREKKK